MWMTLLLNQSNDFQHRRWKPNSLAPKATIEKFLESLPRARETSEGPAGFIQMLFLPFIGPPFRNDAGKPMKWQEKSQNGKKN